MATIDLGVPAVRPRRDLERVARGRRALGDRVEPYVDANGGYGRKQAVRLGRAFADEGVTWFEEPVSSDDLDGLREVRDQCPADVAAGEYGWSRPGGCCGPTCPGPAWAWSSSAPMCNATGRRPE